MLNNSSGNTSSQQALLYQIIGQSVVGVIFIVGIIGNIMVILVVARTKSMRTPTNCYLLSLAVADCLALLSTTIPIQVDFHIQTGRWVFGEVGCRIIIFCQYTTTTASVLSITAFTIERYIAICHPMKAQTVCTVSRAKRIIGGTWGFSLVYNSPWLFFVKITTNNSKIPICDFSLDRKHYIVIYMCDLMLLYVSPLLLTCVLYGLIGRMLFRNLTPGGHNDSAKRSSSRVQVMAFVTECRDRIYKAFLKKFSLLLS
ncbi:unnamed protein product [Dimorphilus gyrociliatus]|uniref:Thyrotropin-releasing hormone receptor n=1 Tax=Dimorphilus gyrociliatus TaxID=2664684 RepID=A0A7I8V3J5_9ANNE|nr:unnamed protein product [Dimorphilus gyrociliatus]